MPSLLQFFLRFSRRNLTYTLLNYTGLVIGFMVAIILVAYLYWEYSYDDFNGNQAVYRIIRKTDSIYGYKGKSAYAVTPGPLGPEASLQMGSIEKFTRISSYNAFVKTQQTDAVQIKSLAVDPEFFTLFPSEWLIGSIENFKKDPHAIILTERTATRLFGELNVLGRSVPFRTHADHGNLIVQGVIKDFPTNRHLKGEAIVHIEPFVSYAQPGDLLEWRNANYYTYVKLRDDADVYSLQANLDSLFYSARPDLTSKNVTHILQPLRDIHFNQETAFDQEPAVNAKKLVIILIITITILLLACANYTNMAIAQSINRAREIGIRKANGAQSKDIIFQFFGETTLFCSISFLVAFVATYISLPFFNYLLGVTLDLHALLTCLPYLLGALALTVIAAGLYPSFILSGYRPAKVLTVKISTPEKRNFSTRDTLVASQFVISAMLVILITVFQSQLNYLLETDPGFNREQILNIPLKDPKWRGDKLEYLKDKILQHSSTRAVTISTSLPHDVRGQQGREWKSDEGVIDVSFYTLYADEHFVDLYGLEILEGRNIMPNKGGIQEFLINETAAREYGWEEPVGMEFLQGQDTIRIVGLLKDFHLHNKHLPISSFRIGHWNNGWASYISVAYAGDNKELTRFITSVFRELSDDYPFEFTHFDERYAHSYEADQKSGEAMQFFTIVSLVITSLGLYGLVLFAVNSRTKEISIRKVLGASWRSISWLLGRNFIKLTLVGFALACIPAYYLAERWLSDFAYRITIGADHFTIALIILSGAVVITLAGKLLSANQINPAEALRKE
jgi:putative ABC transport system permease protein